MSQTLADPKNQFKVVFAQLDVPVIRTGWTTDDRIAGGSKADELNGEDGDDVLKGNGDDDVLRGGNGSDLLVGGPGVDEMFGESGRDVFDFNPADDLMVCPACDTIEDFRKGKDRIDVSDIDARAGSAKNDAFTFVGAAKFSGAKGELRYRRKARNVIVQADTNGDGKADFEILVRKNRKLAKRDFVL